MNPTRIFLNGTRWWLRLNAPTGERPRISTGTSDKVIAQRIAVMVDELLEDRSRRPLIDALTRGDLTLAEAYDRRSRGQLDALVDELVNGKAGDPNIEPMVGTWLAKLAKRPIADSTKRDYARQIRRIIPIGRPFAASDFSEDVISDLLDGLTSERTGEPLTGSTKNRYIAPLRLFYRYARKQIPTLVSPFDDPDWLPKNNPSRMKYWDHATVLKVLDKVADYEARTALTLLFATGIELGALLDLRFSDIGAPRTLTARGTKNNARRNRTVFVDAWAWNALVTYAKLTEHRTEDDRLFDFSADGSELRDAFYAAQVAAGLVPEPPKSKSGKKLWSAVDIHTLHDCRHSYCYTRILGDDGEPRQSLKYCAHQLGHTTEQMVMQIYGKARMEDRIREIEKAEAFKAGQQERTTA